MTSSSMWSGGYAAEIDLRFHFSNRLLLTLICLYGSVAVLLCLMLKPGFVIAAAALLALSLLACARLPCVGWSREAVVRAIAHDDNSWSIEQRCGRVFAARLSAGRVFGSSLVFVRWDGVLGQRVVAVLFSDSSGTQAFRRLRARLLAAGQYLDSKDADTPGNRL